MKKKFKLALLSLLIIPCLLFVTACTKDISMSEFQSRMGDSAVNYYQNKQKENMTIVATSNSTNTYSTTVYFGADDENGLEAEFKVVTESTMTIELYKYAADEGIYRNAKVTEVEKKTTYGMEENDAETGLQAFTDVEETTTITTFVQGAESCVAYTYNEYKLNTDEEHEVEKEKYTYYSTAAYEEEIDGILEEIDSEIMENGFFTTSYMLISVAGGEISYYANGDSNFGVKSSIETTTVRDKAVTTTTNDMEISFENNLPYKAMITATSAVEDKHTYEMPTMGNLVTNQTTTIEMKYSANNIVAPTDFENAEDAYYSPDIEISVIG